LESLPAMTVIADKGYDADERVLNKLEQAGKTAVKGGRKGDQSGGVKGSHL
jgi:hypothetical protein